MKVEATLPLLQFLRTAEAASRGVVLSVAARDLRRGQALGAAGLRS
jgi:hypothetical protein